MKKYIVTVDLSAEIEIHYNLQKRILKVRVKRLGDKILNGLKYMLELNSQVHKSTKNFKKLQVSLDNVNRVLGLLRESFTLFDKGSLHEGW